MSIEYFRFFPLAFPGFSDKTPSMKLLLSGDLHLGRTSTRIPPAWAEDCRTLAAWERLVDAALAHPVRAVLLSGDLLDQANQFWETIGPFERGVRRLSEAGIDTLAVCGNHDARVLPSIADSLRDTRFHLLGRDGTWERFTLHEHGAPRLHIDGWSFPAETVFRDPTADYPPSASDGVPVLGLVHGDPGVADSRYAPLDPARLRSLPLAGWLLGHIHKPSLQPGAPWILMPGSPHPLDPGEPDAHHAWIAELRDGTLLPPEPLCPARLRYTSIDLPLDADAPPTLDQLHQRLRDAVEALRFDGRHLLRVTLSGTTPDPDRLRTLAAEMEHAGSPDAWAIEHVRITARPPLDLDACRRAGPVPALLADALKQPPPELDARVDAILDHLRHQPEYDGKSLPPLTREDVPLHQTLHSLLRTALEEIE